MTERRDGKHPFLKRMADNLQALLPFRPFIHSFVPRHFFFFFAIFSACLTLARLAFSFLSPFLQLFGAVLPYFFRGDDTTQLPEKTLRHFPTGEPISIIAGVLHLEPGNPLLDHPLSYPVSIPPSLLFGLESVDAVG